MQDLSSVLLEAYQKKPHSKWYHYNNVLTFQVLWVLRVGVGAELFDLNSKMQTNIRI